MPQPAGQLIDLLLRRVRDPEHIAITRAYTRTLLSEAQRLVNLASPGVLQVADMPTNRGRVVYDWASQPLTRNDDVIESGEVARIDAIRDNQGVDLVRVDWRSYARVDRHWIKKTRDRPRFWSRLGRDLVVIWPAPARDSTVTLVYVKLTDNLTSDDMTTEVRDDRLPAVLALAEAFILTHRRLYAAAQTALMRLDRELLRLPTARGDGQAVFFNSGGTP